MPEHMAAAPLVAAEELLHMYVPDKRVELVRGQLIVREPAGFGHGIVGCRSPGPADSRPSRRSSWPAIAA
ncbi:MAG TPA: hypothetical protein VLE53_10270 [Gemmatimonadaceae bacterium]|nr:hypothetical protein [Gemmatimonadaceae bacterium]